MAAPSAKPVTVVTAAAPPPEGEELILMGRADFTAGLPGVVNVADFGLTVKPLNFDVASAIQIPADVDGLLTAPVAPSAPGGTSQDLSGPGGAGVGDTLTPDPAIAAVVSAVYSAPSVINQVTADLTYDGGPPADSVVKGVWRGVELIIFVTIAFE